MSRITRRRLLSGVAAIALLASPAEAAISLGVVPTTGGGGGSVNLSADRTLVNNSGSTMASGTVSPSFGQWFVQGDIPSGTAPKFLVSGVAQPFSWGMQVFWGDGSLRWARFRLRTTFSLVNGASQAIQIWSGGTAPSASGRTLTEVYAQGIVLNATATSSVAQGTSGAWKAILNNGTNSANIWTYGAQTNVTLDGDAGKGWNINCHMSQTAGGSAHGSLEVEFDIDLLTDSGNALGGVEVFANITQPWYNPSGGTAPNTVAFDAASCNVQWGAGPTTISLPWPYSAQSFTTSSGGAVTTVTTNYWTGGAPDLVPCYVTGGSLPTGLSINTLYSAISDVSPSNQITWASFPNVAAGNALNPSGNGSGTITPCPIVARFDRLPFAGTDGRYNCFQGTGSGNTGTSTGLNWQFDKTYAQRSRLFNPLKVAASVSDTTWTQVNWAPYSVGNLTPGLGATGPRADLAFIPGQNIQHFFNQSVKSEALARHLGLCHGHMAYHFRDQPTTNLANTSNTAYTGMPAASPGTVQYISGFPGGSQGFTGTSGEPIIFTGVLGDHRPGLSYYPYLVFGEPYYLRQLNEFGNSGGLGGFFNSFTSYVNTALGGVNYYGVNALADGEMRSVAWLERDRLTAAAMQPATTPDGSQFNTYMLANAAQDMKYHAAVMDAEVGHTTSNGAWGGGAAQTLHVTNGIWAPLVFNGGVGSTQGNSTMFELVYVTMGMCYAAAVLGDQNAINWCATQSTFFQFLFALGGGWLLPCYYYSGTTGTFNGLGGADWPPITSVNQLTFTMGGLSNNGISALIWTLGTPGTFTMTTNGSGVGYVPNVGDIIWFADASSTIPSPIPSALSLNTPYFFKTVTGAGPYAITVATTAGGTAINFSDSGICANFNNIGIQPQAANSPAAATGLSLTGAQVLFEEVQASIYYLQAIGMSGLGTASTDITTRFNASASAGATNAEWTFQNSYA